VGTMQLYIRTNQKYFVIEGDESTDQRESEGIYDGESAELPVSGTVKILIYCSAAFGSGNTTIIDKVSFDYWPFINGAHQKYTGDYHKVSQAFGNVESVDDQVYVRDSPVRLAKGALHKFNGTDYELSNLFWNASVFIGGPPILHTYIHLVYPNI
jgi:hypothetical protein